MYCYMCISCLVARRVLLLFVLFILFLFSAVRFDVPLFVTLLRALRPDVGGWVTLSPRYWTGVPSDGGRAPYSAVLMRT